MNNISPLLRAGENVGEIKPGAHDSQEWAYGYSFGEIQNSTHEAGNSVVLNVEPQGAVEPVLIRSDIVLTVKVLQGKGYAVIYNTEKDEGVNVVELDMSKDPLVLVKGDAYYYLNSGKDNLILRDDSSPAFKDGDELQLTTEPKQGQDGRTIRLPNAFWRGFELTQ